MGKLSNKTVTYENREWDKKKLILHLRTKRISYSEIAKIVGCSRAYVGYILNKNGKYGNLDYQELRNEGTFKNVADEQIARELKVPVHRVSKARKDLGIKKHNMVKLHNRRKKLVKFLFGDNYLPTNNFVGWLEDFIKDFTDRQKDIIISFYGEGASESTQVKTNWDSDRVYRSLIRKDMSDLTSKLDVKDLIEKEVIYERRIKSL